MEGVYEYKLKNKIVAKKSTYGGILFTNIFIYLSKLKNHISRPLPILITIILHNILDILILKMHFYLLKSLNILHGYIH